MGSGLKRKSEELLFLFGQVSTVGNLRKPRISISTGVLLVALLLTGCSTAAANISSSSSQVASTPEIKYTVNFSQIAGEVPPVTFEMAIARTDWPEKLKIYKMVKPEITIKYVTELSSKFGITGEIIQGEGGFSIQDKDVGSYFDIYRQTGTIWYKVASKLYPHEKPVLPSDEEAKKIAMDFLSTRGLLPEGDVASKVSIGGSSGYPAHLLVHFSHVIDIAGPGAKHGVRIGNNGEVIDVFINPINPLNLPVQEIAPAISVNEAFKEMKSLKKYYVPLETRNVTITEIKIAYFLEPIDTYQEYIVPVYVLGGQCFDKSGQQIGNFSGYAHAVN
jgi:hypothetical protein